MTATISPGNAARTIDAMARMCPFKAFSARLLKDAVEANDVAWIEKCGRLYVEAVTPNGCDPDEILERIVAIARASPTVRADGVTLQLDFLSMLGGG